MYVGGFSRFLVTPEKQVSYDGSVSVGGREGIKTSTIHAWQGWFGFLFLSDDTCMFATREDDTRFPGLCGRVGVDQPLIGSWPGEESLPTAPTALENDQTTPYRVDRI